MRRREFITLLGVAAAWPQEKQRRTSMMNIRSFFGVACAAVAIATAVPAAAQEGETVTLYFNQAIPNIPGKSLVAQFVDYAPGGVSAPHAHAKSAFILAYVLSGEIESQVNDEPKRVYRALLRPGRCSCRNRLPGSMNFAAKYWRSPIAATTIRLMPYHKH